MNRIEIIQSLIDKKNYKTYLEIGVRDGSCFDVIKCESKVGVDPDTASKATIFKTSDDFFALNNHKFDIVFIDGLHHSDQVYKDILNSLAVLNEGGTIVMHDCMPTSKFMQEIPMRSDHNEWTGDTWKAYVKLRTERSDLAMFVVNCDWGCGVITRGAQTPLVLKEEMTYENFERNKGLWLNVISPETFKASYLK